MADSTARAGDDPPYPDPGSRNVLEPDCTRCPELSGSRECISWGNGSLDADVLVVGEAPGAGNPEEERWRGGNWTGLAYTARHSGRLLRGLFAELGYAPGDLYVTNAVKCFPAADPGASPEEATNREPTDEELSTCFAHLETEIEQVDPAVIVTTGKHATRIVLDAAGRDLDGFVDGVLDPVDCPALDATVVPVLHPAYQAVWRARLGYDREEYVAALGDALAEHTP